MYISCFCYYFVSDWGMVVVINLVCYVWVVIWFWNVVVSYYCFSIFSEMVLLVIGNDMKVIIFSFIGIIILIFVGFIKFCVFWRWIFGWWMVIY